MPVKTFRPLTPSTRYITIADFSDITKTRPEKSLVEIRKKSGGRNHYGRATARGAGGLKVGARILSGPDASPDLGNSVPLKRIPVGIAIHNIELHAGKGGQIVRSAGSAATLMSLDAGYAQIRLPSGEIRRIQEDCYATIGQVGNTEHENVVLGKAGRSRHRGIRPINRGVSRNPVDHPNGGGAGKSKSGGGWQQLTSPWGLLANGDRTRGKRKLSSRFIVVRRDGRLMKQKYTVEALRS